MVELLSIEDGTGACSWVFRTPKFPFDGLLSAPGLWVKYTSVTSSMINVVRNYNTMSQNLEKKCKISREEKKSWFFRGEKKKVWIYLHLFTVYVLNFPDFVNRCLYHYLNFYILRLVLQKNIWNICTICRKKVCFSIFRSWIEKTSAEDKKILEITLDFLPYIVFCHTPQSSK